jgi:flavin-dependent dehydrogenase
MALVHPAGEGWLAVGDAAASFDPLTSQGMPNALASAIAGADAIDRWFAGDRSALGRYAATVVAGWRDSLAQLAAIYAAVDRWPHALFWARQSRPVAPFAATCPAITW